MNKLDLSRAAQLARHAVGEMREANKAAEVGQLVDQRDHDLAAAHAYDELLGSGWTLTEHSSRQE